MPTHSHAWNRLEAKVLSQPIWNPQPMKAVLDIAQSKVKSKAFQISPELFTARKMTLLNGYLNPRKNPLLRKGQIVVDCESTGWDP